MCKDFHHKNMEHKEELYYTNFIRLYFLAIRLLSWFVLQLSHSVVVKGHHQSAVSHFIWETYWKDYMGS
jgi:hypothetical protein